MNGKEDWENVLKNIIKLDANFINYYVIMIHPYNILKKCFFDLGNMSGIQMNIKAQREKLEAQSKEKNPQDEVVKE